MFDFKDILTFWFDECEPKQWFIKSDDFDRAVALRLGAAYEAAALGELDSWADQPLGAVALCELLDQVPRNLYRGTERAFATDAKALGVAKAIIASGADKQLTDNQRLFLYLPYEHSEVLADQEAGVVLTEPLENKSYYEFAIKHRDIIVEFGRFPHRNAALGRVSTPEEEAYLAQPGAGF